MKTIIDIGAAGILKLNQNNTYYLFEPEEEAYNNLIKKFDKRKNVFIFNTGLYDKKSIETLYVARKKQCSSLLPPNLEIINKYNAKRFLTDFTSEIKVDRLDAILSEDLEIIDLLKLDTQGTEYEILVGCGNLLKKVKTIICEVEHIELYKNQKLFPEIREYLKDYGFVFKEWKRQVRWEGDLIFGDALFLNQNLQ
jgi:FkbM family methyltransferase